MFVYDDRMADLVIDYCRQRLAMYPVPLDYGGLTAELLSGVLDGLMTPRGNDPAHVLDLFVEHLARAVVSCDSPRFLSFIPAAPTKAALLFDMVVSCSSLQATSWLEAAGAVAAENQALRVLADIVGLRPGAGGLFRFRRHHRQPVGFGGGPRSPRRASRPWPAPHCRQRRRPLVGGQGLEHHGGGRPAWCRPKTTG